MNLIKNGACTKKGCRFVHFDPESAYPSRTCRQNYQRNHRDNQTPRQDVRPPIILIRIQGQVIIMDINQVKGTTIMSAISSKILEHGHMATDVNLGISNNISTMLPTLTV